MAFPSGIVVKNPPAMQEMQETQVQSPGQEDPWSRKWQPTPVSSPGKFHERRSLAGCGPWGLKESDMTKHTRVYATYYIQGMMSY